MAEENTTEETEEQTEEVTATAEETSESTTEEVSEEAAAPQEAAEEPAAAEETQSAPSSNNELADNLVSQLPSVEGEDAPRKEVPGGRAYEIIYIVRTGDPSWVEQSIERVRQIIEGNEGAVDNVRASETRRLAYPIEKQTEGIYVVTNARFAGGTSEDLEHYFRIEESVLRYMVLREED